LLNHQIPKGSKPAPGSGSKTDVLGQSQRVLSPSLETAPFVVYSAFESQRLAELAAWLPDFGERIKDIQARLRDLLPVIRNRVYHRAFAGSFSLKSVPRP